MKLTDLGVQAGVWHGHIAAGQTPVLHASHQGEPLTDLKVEPAQDGWNVRLALPAYVLSDGVQTIVITGEQDQPLHHIVISCGQVLDHDVVAQIALLRAELALLQKAFRQHCADQDGL